MPTDKHKRAMVPIEVVPAPLTGEAFQAVTLKGWDTCVTCEPRIPDCETCASLCVDYARIQKECQTVGMRNKRVFDYINAMARGAEEVIRMGEVHSDCIIVQMHMATIYAVCDYARKHRAKDCYFIPRGIISGDQTFTDYGKENYRADVHGTWEIKKHTKTFLDTVSLDGSILRRNTAGGVSKMVTYASALLQTFFVKRAKGISKVLVIGGHHCPRAHASWVDVGHSADSAQGWPFRGGTIRKPPPGHGICECCRATTPKRCPCKQVFYCSTSCQTQEWRKHKKSCTHIVT